MKNTDGKCEVYRSWTRLQKETVNTQHVQGRFFLLLLFDDDDADDDDNDNSNEKSFIILIEIFFSFTRTLPGRELNATRPLKVYPL